MSGGHFAMWDDKPFRSRCKNENCKFFTHLFCVMCKVHLCITAKRNCFYDHHHRPLNKKDTSRRNTLVKIPGQKPCKRSKQTTKPVTVADEKGSGRRHTEGCVSKCPKRRQNEQIELVNNDRTTRSGRRKTSVKKITYPGKPKRTSLQQLNFMSMVGLIPMKMQLRKSMVPCSKSP